MANVLVVDDEEKVRIFLQRIVSGMGHKALLAKDAEEAKSVVVSEEDIDVALVDCVFPGKEDGLAILEFIRVNRPCCQTILVSGHPTFDSASEEIRRSAFDYLTKSFKSAHLCRVIEGALKEKSLREQEALDAERSKKAYDHMIPVAINPLTV